LNQYKKILLNLALKKSKKKRIFIDIDGENSDFTIVFYLPRIPLKSFYLTIEAGLSGKQSIDLTEMIVNITTVTIEILSKNGDFLYRFRSPFVPRCLRFGKIYVIEYNELREYRIRRIEIKGYSEWK